MNLLESDILAGAAAFNGWRGLVPDTRAKWVTPLDSESNAPARRIIHCRTLQVHCTARLDRLGLKPAPGTVKCGSRTHVDWITSFRLLVWDGSQWTIQRAEQNLPRPADNEIAWFDLGSVSSGGVIVEARSCEIDGWWTSWNLVHGGVVLEGKLEGDPYTQKEHRLTVGKIGGIPPGVEFRQLPGELRFRTRTYEVGFWLGRAGFSFLAVDDTAGGKRNLLRSSPSLALQGPVLRPVGIPPVVAPLLRNVVSGSVHCRGGTVSYHLHLPESGVRYDVEWTMKEDRIGFRMIRQGDRDLRAWESSAWKVVCDSEVTPTTALGRITRTGETGLMTLPFLFDAPGHGTFLVAGGNADSLVRSDSNRPLTFTSLEFKIGEIPQCEGDYLLPKGEYAVEGEFTPFATNAAFDGPRPVVEAIRRRIVTAITYRADTATLTNNGNSMHAPMCMDNWSAVITRAGAVGFPVIGFLRDTLERWLDGGPGYASGGMQGRGVLHSAEDEFIMTGTAGLLGLAEFLDATNDWEWFDLYEGKISHQITLMKKRDVDGDGIVESLYRNGISGSHDWSTNWYDVISFGWKDAFANALLCKGVDLLGDVFARRGRAGPASLLRQWADDLRSHYFDTFFNPETGWLGGWRDRDGQLHDYAFLFVNGAAVCTGAVTPSQARRIIGNLWREMQRIEVPDPRLGLPGNLWTIPDRDMASVMHGKPMGYYLNGGLTHSQSRHFVGALYAVGMQREGDELLSALCERLADGTAFGGCNSGVDWRYWDGAPCGYEGILTDQFGILAVALDRYASKGRAE